MTTDVPTLTKHDTKRDIADRIADATDLLESIGSLDLFPSFEFSEPERAALLVRLERLKQSLERASRTLGRGQG